MITVMAEANPGDSEIRIVATADDRRALAKVVARATRRQLYTEPWRSTLAVALMAVAGGLLGVVWSLAGPVVSYAADAAGILTAAIGSGLFVMGLATRISTPRELDRTGRSGRSGTRAWILRTDTGTAGVLVRDADTKLWRPVGLSAHPPRAGLGHRLGQHLQREADAAGATIRDLVHPLAGPDLPAARIHHRPSTTHLAPDAPATRSRRTRRTSPATILIGGTAMIDLDKADKTADKGKVCCYHADAGYVDDRTGYFELIRVTRDQPGYTVVATYAGLADAETRAAGLNQQGGIDDAIKRDIIGSSVAASRTRERRTT